MKDRVYIVFALLALVVLPHEGLADESPVSPGAKMTGLKPLAEVLPDEMKLELLGDRLLSLHKASLAGDAEATNEAFAKVRKELLETAGYAVHYGIRLRKLRSEALANPDRYPLYEAYAVRAFGILELLPGVEAVAIVSTFLNDSWNPSGASDAGCPSVNAHRVLGMLLQDPPETERPFDAPAWLEWRKAVREGERTFKLKGSDVDFNFAGPVEKK